MTYTTIFRFVITWTNAKHWQSYYFYTIWSDQVETALKGFQEEHQEGIIIRVDRLEHINAAL